MEIRSIKKSQASQASQASHMGATSKNLVNGEFKRERERLIPGDVISWTEKTIPSLFEVIRLIRFRMPSTSDPAYKNVCNYLELRGIDPSQFQPGSIAISRILNVIGYGAGHDWDAYLLEDPKLALTPMLLVGAIVANYDADLGVSFVSFDQSAIAFASRLFWSITPKLVRFDVDVYNVNTSKSRLASNLERTNQHKDVRVERRLNIRQENSVMSASRAYKAKNETQKTIQSSVSDLFKIRYAQLELTLIPSKNRGKHICTVKVSDHQTGFSRSIGTIRVKKGKLFFACPQLLTGKAIQEKMKAELKQVAYSKNQRDQKHAEIISALSAVSAEISAIQRSRHEAAKSALTAAKQLKELRSKQAELKQRLAGLSASDGEYRTELSQLPIDWLNPLLTLFKWLGMHPNQYLSCLPKDSSLTQPVFWLDRFGVKISYTDFNKPIEFISDTRNGSDRKPGLKRNKYGYSYR